jgi:glycosyltransferase involved in cell wall biosynthesis
MKPRVLMIAYACNPEGNGEHWLGWGWAEQAAKDFTVHLITTPNARAPIERHAPRHGITPHFVPQPAGGRWGRKLRWQARVRRYAAGLHAREPLALVHQTTFHSFRVPFRAAELGLPAVWGPIAGGESVPPGFGRDLGAARFSELGRRLLNRLWLRVPSVRRSFALANALFVSNHTTLAFLPAAARAKAIVVPPNALRPEDETFLAPGASDEAVTAIPVAGGNPPSTSFQLLYVGNCVATRALPLVFDALRRLERPNVRLTIVGAGPALPRWKALVQHGGLAGRVEFTGQVPRERLPEFYQRADALVFPALRDSGGSALLEAMARGVPVICLDWAGPGEMVDANSGIKVPVQDRAETVAGLAAAVTRLHDQPGLRAELARSARARAGTHFRWEAKRRLLQDTYQRLLNRS